MCNQVIFLYSKIIISSLSATLKTEWKITHFPWMCAWGHVFTKTDPRYCIMWLYLHQIKTRCFSNNPTTTLMSFHPWIVKYPIWWAIICLLTDCEKTHNIELCTEKLPDWPLIHTSCSIEKRVIGGNFLSLIYLLLLSRGRLNIKIPSYPYRDSNVKNKTVSRLSYL